ncbi:heme-degrading domain-containing protein [Erwinia endophytica]|uniref:heme-degrading domain-containing protein n=1 Tax=Erwinia endophytica TaxID=1563158 RepID=UPI00126605D7|nr:heme-degrading domain-containing protein [Erwinia endophytica]KAB8312539.1 heme-degrading domain-containing protein [Erwinia endophytica]
MSLIPTPETLLQQEKLVRLSGFSFTDAWTIGVAIRQRAIQENAPIAIEVYAFGQVLFTSTLPGSSAENLEWIARKRNTVLRNGHASLYTGESNEAAGIRMAAMNFIDQQRYTDHGGSFPLLLVSGGIIGAVTVSGLPSHEDHALAMWGIQQVL